MNQQSKKNLTNRIVALAGITVFAFFIGIYVCVFSNYLEQHNTRKKLFGATYMTMNNEFYKIVNNQIRMQVEKNGDQMITLDPALDQKKQNEQIKQLVKRKVDAIFLNPVDWKAVEPGLVAAKKAKIPVIVIDSQVYRSDLVAMTIVSDNYKAGVECANDMMSKLDEGSKIAVMDQPSGTACVQREQGFLDTVGDYFEIVSTTDTEGDTAKTMTAAEDVLTADDDLAAFFCINDMGALGCVQAAQAAGKDDILIYGVDGNPDFMGYVADGSATASAAQQPSVIGQKALDAAIDTLDGKEVEHDQTVDVVLINKDNIADFDVTDWQ